MTKTRLSLWACAVFALVLLGGVCLWHAPKAIREAESRGPPRPIQRFMVMKAKAATEIHEGLAKQDYHQVETGLNQLRKLHNAADWYFSEQQYGDSAGPFWESLDQLSQAVDDGDLAKANSDYVQLMASCEACHRRVAPARDGMAPSE